MRFVLSAILLLMMVPVCAFGWSSGMEKKGGYVGPVTGADAETAREALNQPDGARVVVTGHIISRLAGARDEYMFQDSTGEIQVKISPKLFRGMEITPGHKVRISGRLGKRPGKDVEIDTKILEIVQ